MHFQPGGVGVAAVAREELAGPRRFLGYADDEVAGDCPAEPVWPAASPSVARALPLPMVTPDARP